MFKIEDDMELSLGRKKNNHIKLKDISVSRNHCLILKKDNNLLMKDLRSKFGTMRYINNFLEINLQKEGEGTKLLTGKHALEFMLDKSWSLFKISNIFKFSCCSCNQPLNEGSELIIYGEDKENMESQINNDDLKNKKKMEYYSKFKDYDSYNDYIIKIDNIIGLDNSELNIKDKQENEGNENENSNIQIKDKEESFTNYY